MRKCSFLLALMTAFVFPGFAVAQHTMLYHGFGAGTSTDYIARVIADALERQQNKSYVVVPKSGAGTTIAGSFVSRQNPDGSSLLVAVTSGFSVAPVLFKKMPYTPTDFTPITLIGKSEFLLVVRAGLPVNSVEEFLEYARIRPGILNYSGSTIGLMLGAELNVFAGIQAVSIPASYGVETQAVNEMIAGRIDYSVITAGLAAPQVRAGTLRALAVATKGESVFDQSLPALEKVVPGFVAVDSWTGLLGPRGMSPALVEKINATFRAVIDRTEVTRVLRERLYFQTKTSSPEEMTAYMTTQAMEWKKIAEKIGYESQ